MSATSSADASTPGAVSAWAPLAIPAFRMLWFAQLGSNIGTWMQTVGAQWYLVDAAAGATIIALVQTASLAPAVLFSLPAGVLADSLDRRRLLIWGSAASAVIAAVLTVIAFLNDLTPWTILGFTFLLGITSTLTSPAWQAIQPELVPRPLIGASSALGGVTVNGARAVGPALAGVLLSLFGAPLVFGINALSFVAAVIALLWWRRPPQSGLDDREPFTAALRAGVRYVASAHLVRRILLRSALFALPASALWALLPVTAKRLDLAASGYGFLLGALGAGAVLGIFVLPVARKRFSDNTVIAVSALLFAAGTLAAAWLPFVPLLLLLVLAGVAWIGTLTVLNAALQLTLPQWVRSRGASIYILVFMGTMAVGSFGWGALAGGVGTATSLAVAAALLVVVAASVMWLPLLPGTGTVDRTVSLSWPTPTLVLEPQPTDGPVLVQIAYTVRPDDIDAFRESMRLVESSRRRTGGYRWTLLRSGEEEDLLLESFMVPSWGEYRRQQTQRQTGRDREIQATALAHSDAEPREKHYFPEPSPPRGSIRLHR
ncbi:MFS transporter [Microbacterium hydrocarbonoxydans]|uniref:Predicted arabinose efflux permease, MFS family n=1 Tax=Microbacterium hydrocarbonoxydans TaxID=273678 RepID=A0A1H4JHS5_9MICO|nr:MFS transporter [Microbacterium hydrocarbonoxydans]SEB45879.1 Predicted arabinose efflux permease, MFS family [Microbacterium hydrocarbonoxydans]